MECIDSDLALTDMRAADWLMINSQLQYLGPIDLMTPLRSGDVMLSLAFRRIDPTCMVPCLKKLIPAQKAGGATLPLRHVVLHKWRQVTPLQETQVLT